jgi:(2Fe-2S) ferredoxin
MAGFVRHVFVCTNQREPGHPRGCCQAKASTEIREALKAAVERAGLKATVRVNTAGCLDQCEHGPTVVVYPEGVWYGFVSVADVDEIVQGHLVEGRPIPRLRLEDQCINTSACRHRIGGVGLGLPRG